MESEDGTFGRLVVPAHETPVPHEANDLAPGSIPELDARASFDKLMRFAASHTYGTGASFIQGVIAAFTELGWDSGLWSDAD